MKKVVHITTVHKRYDSRIFHKECMSLINLGFEVYLIVADGKGNEIVSGIKIIDLGLEKNRIMKFLFSTRKAMHVGKMINADIYHFHDPDLLYVGMRLKKSNNQVFFDSHEDFPALMLQRDYIPKILSRPLFYLAKSMEIYFSRRISGIITVTDKIAKKFKSYGVKRVEIIKNYPILSPNQEPNFQREINPPIACYVGGLTPIRGVKEMIIACSRAGVKLLLVGPFDSQDYLNSMRAMPEWDNVDYRGYIPYDELFETIYSKSTLGLVLLQSAPNHTHSIPIKQLEYMEAGLPIISSSAIEFCKEITNQTGCGIIVNPLDIDKIVEAIKRIVSNKQEAISMGIKGYNAVKENYNFKSQAKILVDFYNKGIKNKK
ncbi:MAG: glycosyltransferase family 4 protein [Bacteroidales bacterium]